MKKTVLKTICTLSLFLLFCGCENRMEISYTPVSFEEPYGEVYNEEQELGICIEQGKGTYYFSATISEDEAKAYAEEMAQLIKQAEKVAGKRKEPFFVYVCDEAYRTRVEDDTLPRRFYPRVHIYVSLLLPFLLSARSALRAFQQVCHSRNQA